MLLTKPLIGKFASLRSVTEEDSQFTLDIRNNEELTAFIPRIKGSIDSQKAWIRSQINKEGDWFFIIEDDSNRPVGTIALTEVRNSEGTLGRFISMGESIVNIEACLLILDFSFNELNLKLLTLEVVKENKAVNSLWKKFGAELVGYGQLGYWETYIYHIERNHYQNHIKDKIKKLVDQYKI